jgi:hypothetical protein
VIKAQFNGISEKMGSTGAMHRTICHVNEYWRLTPQETGKLEMNHSRKQNVEEFVSLNTRELHLWKCSHYRARHEFPRTKQNAV